MTSLVFRIEGKPIPASRPRVTARGTTYYPKTHMEHKGFLDQVLKTVPVFNHGGGPVEVSFLFVCPPYKTSDAPTTRSDLDNLAKIVMDSMTQAQHDTGPKFWSDDSMVVSLTAAKRFTQSGETPHTEVILRAVPGTIETFVSKVWQKIKALAPQSGNPDALPSSA